jgi:glycosyltransferase involved in cell wall biosynthesis
MKILFLSSYANPSSGASVLIRLANRLKQDGHEVRILTTHYGYDSDITRSVRLPKILFTLNRVLNVLTPNYFSLVYFQLLNEIRNYDPDVINIHWTHGFTIPIHVIPILNRKYPVFWTMHDIWPITANSFRDIRDEKKLLGKNKTPLKKIRERFSISSRLLFLYKIRQLRNVDIHTISPSKWLHERVETSPVFRAATNHHIPNGVDTNVFRPLDRNNLREKYGIPETRKIILFLSAKPADELKGFKYLINALKYIKSNNPQLAGNITTLLVGENSNRTKNYLSTDVKMLERTNNISRLVEYYNLADVFVSASIADNFPSTSLESLACGTPIVAFDVGGIPEIVINGKTGLLSTSRDSNDLGKNIEKLLTDEEQHRILSANCRDYAVNEFSMDKYVNDYLRLFESAILKQKSA